MDYSRCPLGNIYAYLALEGLEPRYREHVAWISVASPICAHDFKSALGLFHVEMINAVGDSAATFGGSISIGKFIEGMTHNAHDFLGTYLHRVRDAIAARPDIFRDDIPDFFAAAGCAPR